MTISIFGLGYVGTISLGCLARDGHTVIGVDVDRDKLRMISEGRSPVVEEGTAELMAAAAASGRVRLTEDVCAAVMDSELSLVCVGSPSAQNGSQDQRAIIAVASSIGEALAHKSEYHVVAFRSTLAPGTVKEKIRPAMEARSGKRDGADFDICVHPEFMREGSSIRDYELPPFTIVGSTSRRAIQTLRGVFGHLPCEFHVTSILAAEMVKYCCNSFHALKITFANEIARMCEALHCDPFEVMDLVCKDTRLNISPAYLTPGFAFGGSCLPKDLRAILHTARGRDVELPMLGAILFSNQLHRERAVRKVLDTKKRKIGMLGLSFKSGTDDLRESPLVLLAEQLLGKGCQLSIYDSEVKLSHLLGGNRSYIEREIPHIGSLLYDSWEKVVEESEVIILGVKDRPLVERLPHTLRPDHILLDLVGMPGRQALPCHYLGACW